MFTGAAAFAFVMYRACLAFDIGESQVFLPGDSWHKLSNVFLFIEFASLIIYLAKLPDKKSSYLIALATIIVIFLQEKDSYSYKYALIPLIFNNLTLISSNFIEKGSKEVNPQMVALGGLWYGISFLAFLCSFSTTLDFYFFFDDVSMFATQISSFYSWQTYQRDPLTLFEATTQLLNLPQTLQKLAAQKKKQNENKKPSQQRQ